VNKTQAMKIIKREFPRYQKLLHLQEWKFTFKYKWIGDEEDQTYGDCTADPSYRSVTISINHELHNSEAALIHTLRHEMLHILHSAFDTYRDMLEKLLDRREFEAVDTLYDFCSEDAVLLMENIFDKELKIPLSKRDE